MRRKHANTRSQRSGILLFSGSACNNAPLFRSKKTGKVLAAKQNIFPLRNSSVRG
jgi:hypothetical protein